MAGARLAASCCCAGASYEIGLSAKRGLQDSEQLLLALTHDEVQHNMQVRECTVPATKATYDIAETSQPLFLG